MLIGSFKRPNYKSPLESLYHWYVFHEPLTLSILDPHDISNK